MQNAKTSLWLFMPLFFFLCFCILPDRCFKGDMGFWHNWMLLIHRYGLGNIYTFDVNYHPIFLYFLYIFQTFQGSESELQKSLIYVKTIPLAFDFLGALLVFFLRPLQWKTVLLPFLLLFNISYLYNSMLWGQVDSIHTFFVLCSVFFILKNKPIISTLFFVLALNTKLQAIVFAPLVGLLFLANVKSIKTIGKMIFAGFFLQLIILIPFLFSGTVDELWRVVIGASSKHPFISLNAFNLWYLLHESDHGITTDDVTLWGIAYKQWGLFLFFSSSFFTLLPLLIRVWRQRIQGLVYRSDLTSMSLLIGGLLSILFFWFNTQMHERYAHPAILFFFLYGLQTKHYSLYILSSLAYLLNMEAVLRFFRLNNYDTLLFNEQFIACLYLLILIIGWGLLYRMWNATKLSYLHSPHRSTTP